LKQRFVFRRSDYINHVYDTLDGQLAGQLWWSVDVGGFFCQMDEETLARDFMLSATAPIMRQVMKRFLLSQFYIKTSFYQDSLGTNIRKTQKQTVFLQHGDRDTRIWVRNRCTHALLRAMLTLMLRKRDRFYDDHFTKTGSGQTWKELLRKKGRFFAGPRLVERGDKRGDQGHPAAGCAR
jgi:hypothetical protein